MKIFFRTVHLYLSLAAGLVIMIACLTGAILVFEKELEALFHPQRYKVEAVNGQRSDLDMLINGAIQSLPGAKYAGAKVYSDPERTIEIGLIVPQKDEKAERKKTSHQDHSKGAGIRGKEGKILDGSPGGSRPTHTAYVNPYTGKVVEIYSQKGSFFQKTMALHRWLLGKNDGIGKYIVGVSTFIFLFILITGIILWWPKTRNILLQRIKIKWDGNWKRLNHDMHLVFGFYSAIFLFIFAFTAMSWSFQWFNKGIYKITNTSAELPEPPVSVYQEGKSPISIEKAFSIAQTVVNDACYYNLRAPKDSIGIFSVTILPQDVSEMQTDTYYIDQFSGKLLGSLKYSDKNLGQRIKANIKPIHVSSIWGLPSKIIGFIVCLLGFTFPVTGVIMWLNRLKGERKISNRS